MIQQFHFWVYIPKELKAGTRRDICTPVFIAALFTTDKRRKQPKYPSTDKWISKMWSIYKRTTKERNSDTCYNMDEP